MLLIWKKPWEAAKLIQEWNLSRLGSLKSLEMATPRYTWRRENNNIRIIPQLYTAPIVYSCQNKVISSLISIFKLQGKVSSSEEANVS